MRETKSMSPADMLREAADLIEPEGAWCRGSFKLHGEDGEDSYCARGAIYEVACLHFKTPELAHAWKEAEQVLQGIIPDICTVESIAAWNDDVGRTQQEVVDALRLAAKRWEEENT